MTPEQKEEFKQAAGAEVLEFLEKAMAEDRIDAYVNDFGVKGLAILTVKDLVHAMFDVTQIQKSAGAFEELLDGFQSILKKKQKKEAEEAH